MKLAVILLFAALAVVPPKAERPPEAVRREQARFQGTWKLVLVKEILAPDEVARKKGKKWVSGPGLEAAAYRRVEGVSYTFRGDRLTIKHRGKGKGSPAHGFATASFRLDFSTTPKGMRITPLDKNLPPEARRTFGAIYLLDGNELWISDNGGNVAAPEDFLMAVGIAYPKRIFILRRMPEKKSR